jgi:hypothetical protein
MEQENEIHRSAFVLRRVAFQRTITRISVETRAGHSDDKPRGMKSILSGATDSWSMSR